MDSLLGQRRGLDTLVKEAWDKVSVLKIPDEAVVKSLDPFVSLFCGHIAVCAARYNCLKNQNLGDLGPRLPFCSSSYRIMMALILEEN